MMLKRSQKGDTGRKSNRPEPRCGGKGASTPSARIRGVRTRRVKRYSGKDFLTGIEKKIIDDFPPGTKSLSRAHFERLRLRGYLTTSVVTTGNATAVRGSGG